MSDAFPSRPVAGDTFVEDGRIPAVVVGGGIAGLATAYELTRRGIRTRVLERGPRVGGVIVTERVDGFLIDAGPDALLAQKPAALDLCREVGLGARIIPTLPPRTAFILRGGVLHPLPEASIMGIPTRLAPLATTGLFSPLGKARMALDVALPRRRRAADEDESIAAFMRRRFGDEAVRYLAQPLLAGIHSGDVERLSMRALFPRLVQAEAKYRSLILAFRRMHAGRSGDGVFRSLPEGLGELVEAVASVLPPETVQTGADVRAVEHQPSAGYGVVLQDGRRMRARCVVLATPAYVAADILGDLDPRIASLCRGIPYSSSATVVLGYPRRAVAHPLAGSGYVVPKVETRERLMAASWVSSKWPGRAPEGQVLLRGFVGGARNPELLGCSDDELVALAHAELARLLRITGEPLLARVYRWTRAHAQHEVGHLARLSELESRLDEVPGVFVTGSAFRGTGVTDCVADARRVAGLAADWLARQSR